MARLSTFVGLLILGCTPRPATMTTEKSPLLAEPPVITQEPTPASSTSMTAIEAGAEQFEDECTVAPGDAGTCQGNDAGADLIQESVRERMAGVRRCYEEFLARSGGQNGVGMVRLTWRVTTTGGVDCVNVTRDSFRDKQLRVCMVKAFSDLHYDVTGCSVAASWGFRFTPP